MALDLSRCVRGFEIEGAVRPGGAGVVDKLAEQRAQVSLAEWDDVVNALRRNVPTSRSVIELPFGA